MVGETREHIGGTPFAFLSRPREAKPACGAGVALGLVGSEQRRGPSGPAQQKWQVRPEGKSVKPGMAEITAHAQPSALGQPATNGAHRVMVCPCFLVAEQSEAGSRSELG